MQKEVKMITKKIIVDQSYYNDKVKRLGEVIRAGGLVAFPTETVYGLGGNALDKEAAKKIYMAKGRPSDNPLIVHVADISEVSTYVKRILPLEKRLMEAFWPGPLTIVFPKKDIVPMATSGGLRTIAIRCPAHEAARALIRAAGVPIAGPSANISTKPSPTTADAVLHDMDGRIEFVIDGGDSLIGLESTVIAVENGKIIIYRPGGITRDMLEAFAPTELDTAITAEQEHPKAPGMKYRHYAPSAPLTCHGRIIGAFPFIPFNWLTVYAGNIEAVESEILSFANKGKGKFGFFVSQETAEKIPAGNIIFVWGRRGNKKELAHNLFQGLLFFNNHPVDHIIGEGTDGGGIGMAIMNRLTKASGTHIINMN